MKIDLTKCTQMARDMMISRGAGKSIFRSNLVLDSSIVLDANSERRSVPIATQLSKYEKSWATPLGSWLLVIGSDIDEDYSLTAAMGLMWQATIKHAQNPQSYARPYLWRLFGGSYDRLRQNDEFRSVIGNIGLLIMTNMAENATLDKIEKCRDLISIYDNIPKVVIVSGCDPLKFSTEKLYINPTRVLYLGRKAKSRQI